MAKVSILMPACNVEKFLKECMDSVVNQTLKDIEIICIDDGSRDSTGNILDEYAQKDNRIKVIHKANSGYGHSMNVGLQNATGEYIGIIETDDFADLNMFDELYKAAKENHADVVKSNYYSYVSQPEPQSTYYEVLKEYDLYDRVFRPVEHPEIFRVRPCIWSGIYRREWLLENHVSFAETPGASYQDTGFAFKVWASAERALLVRDAYLHYRTDNANSSVKAAAKIYCICDEFKSIEEFLEKRPELKEELEKLGYIVNIGIFSAADYGTAQDRQRSLILASKKELGIWKFPKKDKFRKVLFEAIGDLPSLEPGEKDRTRPFHYAPELPACQINFLKHTPTAHSAWENSKAFRPVNVDGKESGAKFKSSFSRKDWNKPCNTITTDSGSIVLHG